MAKLYITEYAQIGVDSLDRGVLAPQDPPIVEQVIDYSGGEAKSSAFNADTRLVRIHTDAICSVLFGANPTASTSNQRLAASQTQFHAVRPDKTSGLKVSAISNT